MALTELLLRLIVSCEKVAHFCRCRISHIVYFVMMFPFIERNFKRQDREHLINIPPDALDAPFLPCPYLRRDIVIDRDARLLSQKLGYAKIESGIIYEYYHIGIPVHYILLAHRHIAEDGAKVKKHGNKAHVCQLLIMPHAGTADGTHKVSS